jgi:hypothetical protein
VHCQTQAASASHVTSPHQSVAERDARRTYCAKRAS